MAQQKEMLNIKYISKKKKIKVFYILESKNVKSKFRMKSLLELKTKKIINKIYAERLSRHVLFSSAHKSNTKRTIRLLSGSACQTDYKFGIYVK